MGFIVSQSIETYDGVYDSLYFRIESYHMSKPAGIFSVTVAGYPNVEVAKYSSQFWGSEREFDIPSNVIPVLISYNDVDIEYPTFVDIPLKRVEAIEVPIFEYQIVSHSIDYEYYSEPGNPSSSMITGSTIQYVTESIQIGTEFQSRSLSDLSILTGSFYTIAYNAVKEEYGKIFGSQNIIDCY